MTLENKLGITAAADLSRGEERISKKKAVELFEKIYDLPANFAPSIWPMETSVLLR